MSIEKSLELDVILAQVERYCDFSSGKERVRAITPSFDRLVIQRDNARIKEALAFCKSITKLLAFSYISS